MKKNFNFALVGAIALTGAMMFSACSESSEIVDNPDYNPETKSVRTTISLNIDPNNSAATRQSAIVTQAEGDFRGMQHLLLFTANTDIVANTALDACLQLDAITVNELSQTHSSKIYTNQEVQVGTTNFLFYGRGTKSAETTVESKLVYGYTETTLAATNTNTSDITFSASSIVPRGSDGFPTGWTTPVTDLTAYLNGIASAEGWSTSTNAQLAFLYGNFAKSSIYRGGSASAVLATVQELYKAVYPISVGEGVDAASKTVASNIVNKIKEQTYVTWDADLSGLDLEFSWKESFDSEFPVSLGLPEGAAQYVWNGSRFNYLEEPVLNSSTATPIENYVYPNELFYLTSSPLRATTSPIATWPVTVGDWRSEGWSGWTNSVGAATKNIAVLNNIQYGSALLATQVRCETANYEDGGTVKEVLYDNAKANGADQNTPIVYSENMFPLTGILVGGQPSQVGWDFLPTASATFNKDVYDGKVISGIYANNEAYSSSNYTLVYDNLAPVETQYDVNICLEFTNNSGFDFYGKDGVILKGQKFYLVAKLALTDGTGDLDLGFDEARTFFPSKTKRVFIQDFVTTAKVKLTHGDANTPGAIGEAIPTIPDLRTSEQSLGLSVDLEWKPGLTFNVAL